MAGESCLGWRLFGPLSLPGGSKVTNCPGSVVGVEHPGRGRGLRIKGLWTEPQA
ncbi:hypothetical protein [Pasteuria penetrans]|uniref:hypothetical protein n=1 Tax=Pasteuria penetrans TaxID=86005 RepID=UPI00165B8000|nr:hypothetical protein [Pasteuria penetrans]